MLRFAVQNGYHDTVHGHINIPKRPGNSHGGFVHCLKKRKCCRNRTERQSNTTHVNKRLQQLFIVSSTYTVHTVADILRGVAQPSLRSSGNGPEHGGGNWGSWPWRRPKEGRGPMLERRRERVSKLLDRTKSTLPRISLPVGKSAVQENLTSPAPLTGTVDQPLHILPFPASNAIPFSVSTPPPDYIEDSFKAVLTQEAAQEAAQEVTPILPWLYRACGRIGVDAAEYLAAQLCINTLHVVDYSKIAQHRQQSELGPPWLVFDDVAWVGPTSVPSPIATTAALLHRLAHRANQHECGTLVVSLSYQPQHADEVCKALALYLHLYCGFSPRSAALSAGEAFDLDPPLQSALDAGIEEMAALGLGWLQRVILEWKYSGGCVEAAGDAVGGWDRVVPLSFSIRRRKWRVQLWGLPPGVYSYKFIVDGRWCIDVAAPSQTDVWGNANNVCAAVGCAGEDEVNQIVAASDGMAALSAFVSFNQEGPSMSRGLNVPSQAERLRLARFGASILAYYTKSTSLSRRPLPSSVRR